MKITHNAWSSNASPALSPAIARQIRANPRVARAGLRPAWQANRRDGANAPGRARCEMNERNEPDAGAPPSLTSLLNRNIHLPSSPGEWKRWARRFLACNPFYLVSAALLLYGFHRVSSDSNFLWKELWQLLFNFTSLQVYEALLVATAIMLARRALWYDATLLAGLENLFVFVPFILITQGALIEAHYVWTMCGIAALMVAARWSALRSGIRELNFPVRLLGPGVLLLALNVGLPVLYRSLHESNQAGWNPEFGPEYQWSKFTWLLILPAAFALGNFLPDAKEVGALLPPRRRWLPDLFMALWLTATAVHVYCIDYVYTLHVPRSWFAPGLWVLAWTACRRFSILFPLRERLVKIALTAAAVLVPLLALSADGNGIYLALTALNAVIFGRLCFTPQDRRLGRHLLFVSIFLLIAGLPNEWSRPFLPDSGRGYFFGLGVLGYFLLWTVLLRHPGLAMIGAGSLFAATLALWQRNPVALHWAAQVALVFFLLHSLLWVETKETRAARIFAAIAWIIHSFVWVHTRDGVWATCIPGGIVLGVCAITRLWRGRWISRLVPSAATLVLFAGPATAFVERVLRLPAPPLIVFGSFLCFGFGTIAALTRHRWHRSSSDESNDAS
jgi:hypothetical protein